MISKYYIMILTAVIGTLGFGLVFNTKKDKLVYGCIGGLLAAVVYFICEEAGLSLLISNMFAAIVATLYAELIARVAKAPATVFLIPSVIPLTPGGSLYYTMSAIVDGDLQEARSMGERTVLISLGIAVGIVLVSVIFYQISHKGIQLKVGLGDDSSKRR